MAHLYYTRMAPKRETVVKKGGSGETCQPWEREARSVEELRRPRKKQREGEKARERQRKREREREMERRERDREKERETERER